MEIKSILCNKQKLSVYTNESKLFCHLQVNLTHRSVNIFPKFQSDYHNFLIISLLFYFF